MVVCLLSANIGNAWFGLIFPVLAADGDIAIYRDTSGTHDTNNTAFTGVPFITIEAQDGTFTQQANDVDVDLADAGHYLFGYVVQARNDSYSNRISYRSRVTLAGSELSIGHGQGYRRDASNDRYYAYGFGILDANSGDDMRVEVIRQGSNSSTHLLEADKSSLWLLKLDDSWDYFRAQGQDNQATTVAKQSINWATQNEYDTDSFSHSTSVNASQITLTQSGHYLVAYSVGVDGASSRTSITTNLKLNSSEVEQSYDYVYLRNSNSTTEGTATNMTIIEASADDVLELEWGATGAAGAYSTDTRSDRTAITIVKLPDSADYLRVHDSTGGQNINSTSVTPITFDTQDEADNSSFSYNTSSGVTTVQQSSNYLFTTGARSNRGTSGNSRLTRAGAWYVNNSIQNIGNTGMFVRGDQGTPDTFDGGWSAAGIFNLTANDTIDFRYSDDGDNGNTDLLQADSYGITAVNINSLFSSGGTLSVDIVDGGGASVESPSIAMSSATYDFEPQTTTGTLGQSSERIRITNTTQTAPWAVTLAATDGSTAAWSDGGSNTYDFNDLTANANDGDDADTVGGALTIDPSTGTITPQGGCGTSGVSLGSSASFNEGVNDSITLISADGTADTGCYWDITGAAVYQSIPASQDIGTYTINLTLTVS